MTIENIQGLSALHAQAANGQSTGAVDSGAFADALERAIEATNAQIAEGDAYAQALSAGQPVSLHETVLAVEKADIATRAFISVKSRAIEAYQEVMRMQI